MTQDPDLSLDDLDKQTYRTCLLVDKTQKRTFEIGPKVPKYLKLVDDCTAKLRYDPGSTLELCYQRDDREQKDCFDHEQRLC